MHFFSLITQSKKSNTLLYLLSIRKDFKTRKRNTFFNLNPTATEMCGFGIKIETKDKQSIRISIDYVKRKFEKT